MVALSPGDGWPVGEAVVELAINYPVNRPLARGDPILDLVQKTATRCCHPREICIKMLPPDVRWGELNMVPEA